MFQDYALFPHMTVGDNVGYGLVVRKVAKPERERRVGEALEMVRLAGYERRKPAQLSGGQRQRVALARALVNRPRVLLLDEPLGALDLKLREEMQIELHQIQQQVGITFIYVTHDQEEALTMSHRIAVFNQGRIEQVGAPAEVYERPATRFVAGFVGTSNLLTGEVAERIVGTPGTYTVRPEKIHLDRGGHRRRARRDRCAGHDPGGGLRRPRDPLPRRARRRRGAPRGPAEPRDVLDRGARAGGPAVRLHLEAAALPARRGRPAPGGGGNMIKRRMAALAAVAVVAVGACGGGSAATPAPSLPTAVGDGEGAVGLAWPGYVENGSTDPTVDWVTDFEKDSGCKVDIQIFGTSDEAFSLFSTNPEKYDVISASGDASLRLVAGGLRPAGEHRPRPELRRHLRGAQEQALQHGRRRPLRHPARAGLEPADVAAPTT